jgi:nucleoside-diphosphate-sugar epimerase
MNPMNILIIGSEGQLGSELYDALVLKYPSAKVVCSDIRNAFPDKERNFEILDATDAPALDRIIEKYQISQIYHLAAILSARGEQNPLWAWDINMRGLLVVLEAGVKHKIHRMYWPSSIAAFGPNTPRVQTPQQVVMDPNTVYGMSKQVGELWCRYYFEKYGLDVRSLRYPGIISYKTLPGGGTTDYAIDIFHKALKGEKFTCFLGPETPLPMMYIDDAIRATLELMEAPTEQIKERTSYNLAALSFTPEQLGEAIKKAIPGFEMDYAPDFRQKIADSWPGSIDDSEARKDWGWNHQFGMDELVHVMLDGLKSGYLS